MILKASQVIVLAHSQVYEILNELSWANKGVLVLFFPFICQLFKFPIFEMKR